MKRLFAAILLIALVYGFQQFSRPGEVVPEASPTGARTADARSGDALAAAIRDRRSDAQVTGEGRVTRVLSDDDRGSRHQRFILDVGYGTVLVAHNIDLAPRIESLRTGDIVGFSGEYEWNDRGGVVHWTHRDPAGRHEDGWLRHDGRTYR